MPGDDHDHCIVCHDNAFSSTLAGDLRWGWAIEVSDENSWWRIWVCPSCFERYKRALRWRGTRYSAA